MIKKDIRIHTKEWNLIKNKRAEISNSNLFRLSFYKNEDLIINSKFCIVIGAKSVKLANKRNLLRRRSLFVIRETLKQQVLPQGLYVFVYKKQINNKFSPFEEIKKDIFDILSKMK